MPIFTAPSQPAASSLLVPPPMFGTKSAYQMRVRTSSQPDLSSFVSDPHAMARTPSVTSHTSSGSFETANDEFEEEQRAASSQGQQPSTPSISGDMESRHSVSDEDDRSTLKENRRRQSDTISDFSAVTWEGARAM
jgi:hypothetical protein